MQRPFMISAPPLRPSIVGKFRTILERQGIHDALRGLNGRTAHRYTGVYLLDPPFMRSLHLVDVQRPHLRKGEDVPTRATYCSLLIQKGANLAFEDSLVDGAALTAGHPAREEVRAYAGVLLSDPSGLPFGTLCHFDEVPCDFSRDELALMESIAPFVVRALLNLPDEAS
jgi:GAF domain-containing protein